MYSILGVDRSRLTDGFSRGSPHGAARLIHLALGRRNGRKGSYHRFLRNVLGITDPDPQATAKLAAERHERELQAWVDSISTPDGMIQVREGKWDPAKHPRTGTAPNPGWWATTTGLASGSSASRYADGAPVGHTTKTISLRARDKTAVWRGAVIAARGQRLPTALLDWNAQNDTKIAVGDAPKFTPGWLGGGTLELDDTNVRRLTRIGNSGKFSQETDRTALGNVYNEAFHAWFNANHKSAAWLTPIMDSQKQLHSQIRDKSEEAMSETINQVINDMEANRPVLAYDDIMKLKAADNRRHNLTPGHNEPGQRRWRNNARSDKPMDEELFYASIWVLHNGSRNPAPNGGIRLTAMKTFFAKTYRPE